MQPLANNSVRPPMIRYQGPAQTPSGAKPVTLPPSVAGEEGGLKPKPVTKNTLEGGIRPKPVTYSFLEGGPLPSFKQLEGGPKPSLRFAEGGPKPSFLFAEGGPRPSLLLAEGGPKPSIRFAEGGPQPIKPPTFPTDPGLLTNAIMIDPKTGEERSF